MTSLRVFTCGPYGATLRPEACAQRFPRQVGRRSATAGPRADRIHCHECPVGAAHARGEDAPGVEYSLVDVSAPRPVPRPPSPESFPTMPATTTETRPTRTCAHPECGVPFVPTHHRSLYCVDHRTPAAALERKALRDELDAALERAAEATRAKTEPPRDPWELPEDEREREGWISSEELSADECARAQADDEMSVAPDGRGWVTWRWLVDVRSMQLSRLREVVAATKRVVGEAWTKDRPLDEAVRMKCNALELAAENRLRGIADVRRELDDLRTSFLERGERIEVLQRELSAAETRAGYGDRVADRLNHAMLAIIEVEAACRDDIDEDELDAEWAALDAEGVSRRAVELVEYVRGLRTERVAEDRAAAKTARVVGGVGAILDAITPPPGVGAAALLRAVGYQVATVESPRGPVLVVEGARG